MYVCDTGRGTTTSGSYRCTEVGQAKALTRALYCRENGPFTRSSAEAITEASEQGRFGWHSLPEQQVSIALGRWT